MGGLHASAYLRRRLPPGHARELGVAQGRHLDLHVDTIEQRSRELAPVARDLVGRATTAAGVVSEVPAGAGIHGRDKLEVRRELGLACGARDRDTAGLERLAQGL